MIDHLHQIKQFGYESKAALEQGDLRRFAAIMHEHWERKKYRSKSMTNSAIDEFYRVGARQRSGGRQTDRRGRRRLPHALHRGQDAPAPRACCEAGLREVRMRFDFEGTQLVTRS